MLTSLYIKEPQYNSKFKKFLRMLMIDSMSVEIKRLDDIKVKCVEYTNRSGSINWRKIDKEIGAQRNRLLCSKDIELPKKCGYRRFCSNEYKERLCTNLAISLLSSLNKLNLSVGLIDIDARYTTLPKYLLKYTDSVVVVSEQTGIYKEINEDLLCEIGAPLRLSKSLNSLYDCDLIIAPKPIGESISISKQSLILTTKKTKVNTDATIIYDYRIEIDEKYSKIMPNGIEKTYFASALYSLLKIYTLGSAVPSLCISKNKIHTLPSLKALLQNVSTKNLT